MDSDIYKQLREQLDQWSVGYPSTPSGVEIKILEKLFTKEEARLFLYLNLILEKPETVAERAGMDTAKALKSLEKMAIKGLVFRHRKGDVIRYCASPFVVGIYEYQVGRMDKELARHFEAYLHESLYKSISGVKSLLRPIPVNRSLQTESRIASYEDAQVILRKQNRIVVANCICRIQQNLIGQGCEKPKEVCFIFGAAGQYYIDNHMGREISLEEAIEILKKSHDAGLVVQPAGTQNPGGMCNCCGDCCAALRAIKRHPKPAELAASNYFASVDNEECKACKLCVDRCQMDAVRVGDVAYIDRDRCIGCGLCVTKCPANAVKLHRKPQSEVAVPPSTGLEAMVEIAVARDKNLIPFKLRAQTDR